MLTTDRTLNNPNVSASAKEHARHVLEDQFGDVVEQQQVPGTEPGGGKYGSENVTTSRGEQRNRTNVVRGYKAYVSHLHQQKRERKRGRLMGCGVGRHIINPTPSRDDSMLDLRWRIWVLILKSKPHFPWISGVQGKISIEFLMDD